MKTCPKCGEPHNTTQSYCPPCQKAYARSHYEKNRARYKRRAFESNKRSRERNAMHVRQLKDNPCVDCGGRFHHAAMEFDHLRNKTLNVSAMVQTAYSVERIDEEIAKCELVCANCHAVRTYKRMKGKM